MGRFLFFARLKIGLKNSFRDIFVRENLARFLIFFGVALVVLLLDRIIKNIVLDGFRWESFIIDIVLVYNRGVAFSMLSFLDEYLKWLQAVFIFFVFIFLIKDRDFFSRYYIAFGFIFGGGAGNLADRFLHEGVVDYVYYHYGFNFAVFNFADVMIDFGIAIFILQYVLHRRAIKNGV